MSLFSKTLLSILGLVALYCLWPRGPSMARFSPEFVSRQEATAWRAIREGNAIKATGNFYAIYDWQYRFNPVRALTMAQDMSASAMGILKAPDEADQERCIPKLVKFYTVVKRDAGVDLDASAAGREEFSAWVQVKDKGTEGALAKTIAALWSHIYNQPPETFSAAAKLRAKALLTAFGVSSPTPEDWKKVEATLLDSWKALREAVPLPSKSRGNRDAPQP